MAQGDWSAQVEGLLARMTLEEKIGQMTMSEPHYGTDGVLAAEDAARIREGRIGSVIYSLNGDRNRELQRIACNESRLGVPLLTTADVVHGHETIYPLPLGEVASFDPALWEKTARMAAVEASAAGVNVTLAPMLDVCRDPRWGRICEGPGEDPWIGARFAEAKVRGYQQDDIGGQQAIAATAKHFAGYGAVTAGRDYASIDFSQRTMHEIYLPPFAAAVRAGVGAIMPAFVDLAGVPMTANPEMLVDLLRKRWGFNGVIISDFTAVGDLTEHGVAANRAEAAALALKAGVDIDMTSDAYPEGLFEALKEKLVTIDMIDAAVRRVLTFKARLGLFDRPFARGGARLTSRQRDSHRELAREAARKSIVLLKNCTGTLPLLAERPGRLAVIGSLAASKKDQIGSNWAASVPEQAVDYVEGLKAALPGWRIDYACGAERPGECIYGPGAAVALAREADYTLLFLGETMDQTGEGGSRAHPDIPADQRRLADAVLAYGARTIVILTSCRPLVAPWLFDKASTVLAVWQPGTEGGTALADVLTGRWNPTGKLPISWPLEVGQIPIYYAQRNTCRPADPTKRFTSIYLDVPNEPQFPFGYGLSYTKFFYGNMRLSSKTARPGDVILVEVDIKNLGAVSGEETAFLFIRDLVASVARPLLELKGLTRVSLAAGQQGLARFTLSTDDLAFLDQNGAPILEPGDFEVMVGPNASRPALLKQTLKLLPKV